MFLIDFSFASLSHHKVTSGWKEKSIKASHFCGVSSNSPQTFSSSTSSWGLLLKRKKYEEMRCLFFPPSWLWKRKSQGTHILNWGPEAKRKQISKDVEIQVLSNRERSNSFLSWIECTNKNKEKIEHQTTGLVTDKIVLSPSHQSSELKNSIEPFVWGRRAVQEQ